MSNKQPQEQMYNQEYQEDYEQMEGEEEYNYEQSYEYEQPYDLALTHSHSMDKGLFILPTNELVTKIMEENQQTAMITALPEGWNLMLEYFCHFSKDQLSNTLDEEQTGRKMIRYKEDYKVQIEIGECEVCLSQNALYNNVCGHKFCIDCWNYHLKINHTDRQLYELFPLCQNEDCFHRTNYYLIQALWKQIPQIKHNFEGLLCKKYSQMSPNVRLCSNQKCSKALLLNQNLFHQSILTCVCGSEVCRYCGEAAHFPLQCIDLRNWFRMVNDKENQWVHQLVVQKCPMCKEPISKNEGCIHMTCRCGHSFCWICLKIWKGHNNYETCSSISKKDHEEKLKQQQLKLLKDENFFNQRFQQAKSQTQRLQHTLNRLNNFNLDTLKLKLNGFRILDKDLINLQRMWDFVLKVFQLQRRCYIFCFFQRNQFKLLMDIVTGLVKVANKIDDYFCFKLQKDIEEYLKQLAEEVIKKEFQEQTREIMAMQFRDKFFKEMGQQLQIMRAQQRLYEKVKEGVFTQ